MKGAPRMRADIRTLPRALAALTLFAAVLAAPAALANCGAEGCPLAPHGPEANDGRWSFELGYQNVRQDRTWEGSTQLHDHSEGVGAITELETRTRAWTLGARARLTPRVLLIATLPYLDRRHLHAEEESPGVFVPAEWRFHGIGDATAMAHVRALGETGHGAGALFAQVGAKLPTGRRTVAEVEGEQPEPPARLGTGSTDALVGMQWTRALRAWAPGGTQTEVPVSLSVMGRWNGRGSDGYRMGDELHADLSAAWSPVPRAQVLAQLNWARHGRDEVGTTDAEPHHTGATTLYATPGLRVNLGGGVSAYGYWQIRAWAHTNGPQLLAPSHLVLGTSMGIGR